MYSEYDNLLPGALIAYPGPNSNYRGGHANVAVGYDDNLKIGAYKGALLVRNSWGTGWGDHGYAWMSYRYVEQGLAVDWWSMISANWVNTGQFEHNECYGAMARRAVASFVQQQSWLFLLDRGLQCTYNPRNESTGRDYVAQYYYSCSKCSDAPWAALKGPCAR